MELSQIHVVCGRMEAYKGSAQHSAVTDNVQKENAELVLRCHHFTDKKPTLFEKDEKEHNVLFEIPLTDMKIDKLSYFYAYPFLSNSQLIQKPKIDNNTDPSSPSEASKVDTQYLHVIHMRGVRHTTSELMCRILCACVSSKRQKALQQD